MPLTPEVEAALAREALEKAGGRPQAAAPPANADDRLDRLRLAADILGTAIDAHEKAAASLRAAVRLFTAEFAAAVGANIDPTAVLTAKSAAQAASAMEKLRQGARPKTFNQHAAPQDHPQDHSQGASQE